MRYSLHTRGRAKDILSSCLENHAELYVCTPGYIAIRYLELVKLSEELYVIMSSP